MPRILVVEDNPALLRFIESTLSESGFVTETAQSCEIALEKLAAGSFDILITDINLAGKKTGIGLVGQCVVDFQSLKIVVITGMIGLKDSAVGSSGFPGTHGLLFKPFTAEQLLKSVEGLKG